MCVTGGRAWEGQARGVSGDRGREKGWPREQSWTRLKRSGQTGQGEGRGGRGRGPWAQTSAWAAQRAYPSQDKPRGRTGLR